MLKCDVGAVNTGTETKGEMSSEVDIEESL